MFKYIFLLFFVFPSVAFSDNLCDIYKKDINYEFERLKKQKKFLDKEAVDLKFKFIKMKKIEKEIDFQIQNGIKGKILDKWQDRYVSLKNDYNVRVKYLSRLEKMHNKDVNNLKKYVIRAKNICKK